MSRQTIVKHLSFEKRPMPSLPPLVHLFLFIMLALIAVASLNFQIVRELRFGDLMILIFAFLVGVNWYGQRMLEEGYKDGFEKALETRKSPRKK